MYKFYRYYVLRTFYNNNFIIPFQRLLLSILYDSCLYIALTPLYHRKKVCCLFHVISIKMYFWLFPLSTQPHVLRTNYGLLMIFYNVY